MNRSDFLFGYDPRQKKPWQDYVPEQIKSRVEQKPEGKRREWLGRGNVRAAHAGRTAQLQDQQATQQQMVMGQRANMLMQNLPLEERKFMYQQGQDRRSDMLKLGMQQAGFQHAENMYNTRRGDELFDMGMKRQWELGDIGAANQEADRRARFAETIRREGQAYDRPIEEESARRKFLFENENRQYPPQYMTIEEPGGGVSMIEKQAGPLPEGSRPISPVQRITMEQKATPTGAMDKIAKIKDLQYRADVLLKLIQPNPITKRWPDVAGELGPVASKVEGFKERWGIIGSPSNEGITLRQTARSLRSYVLNMLSGGAVTPEEYVRISSTLPNEEDQPKTFYKSLQNFRAELQAVLENQQQTLMGGGYRPTEPQYGPQQNDVSTMSDQDLVLQYKQMTGQY